MRNIFSSLMTVLYFLKQVKTNAEDNATFPGTANVKINADCHNESK